MLAGGIHTNTARPRTAKNLAWKIANVPFFRTVLNNDWEERSQMRTRTATSAEKRGTEAGQTQSSAVLHCRSQPQLLCVQLTWAAWHSPALTGTRAKSAQGTGEMGTGSGFSHSPCSWTWKMESMIYQEDAIREHPKNSPRPENYVATP